MRLVEAIRTVDACKPNAFTNVMKTRWLEEVEGRIYTEILQTASFDVPRFGYAERWVYTAGEAGLAAGDYCFHDEWTEQGLPQSRTVSFTLATALDKGERLIFDGNSLIREDEDGRQTEIDTGSDGDSSTVLNFADMSHELFVEQPYDGIYLRWLEAMIDYHNGEYNRYANTAEMFNSQWDDFSIFICYNYAPANRLRSPHRR